ncbi:MAG TPA: helix-turn-helix transcriptional regulator [Bryobacteraceae bacterium]|nr:helix-turn-helix transcriptional regulator [Bryobacteraceae bacterium]
MIDFGWSDVGNRIRDRRIGLGMSQQDLADAAGITQPGLLRIEKGETNPKMDTLRAVAAALNLTVRELMFGDALILNPGSHLVARVGRILDSGDRAAISALENSVGMIELLLKRAGHRIDDFGSRGPFGDAGGKSASHSRERKRNASSRRTGKQAQKPR